VAHNGRWSAAVFCIPSAGQCATTGTATAWGRHHRADHRWLGAAEVRLGVSRAPRAAASQLGFARTVSSTKVAGPPPSAW